MIQMLNASLILKRDIFNVAVRMVSLAMDSFVGEMKVNTS